MYIASIVGIFIYIYQTFEKTKFKCIFGYIRDCKRPDRDRDRLILSVKTWLFCWNSWKNKDRGANKSLIIHKTSQNNRNDIIWSCIWVYLGKKSRRQIHFHSLRSSAEKLTKWSLFYCWLTRIILFLLLVNSNNTAPSIDTIAGYSKSEYNDWIIRVNCWYK
jgi:hypothetical protein